jgi:5'-methylthioadenosine phosphorylase
MQPEVAIIGGTGVGPELERLGGRAVHVPTAEGMLRARVVPFGGRDVLLIQRHSFGHKVPPHAVNYAAFALGAKALGVKTVFATAAVGSLRADWKTGTLVVVDDFVDVTARNLTLFEASVEHTDISDPFPARHHLIEAVKEMGEPFEASGTYVCANGPRYETPREVKWMATFGEVVGMTATSEAILIREAGIDYGLICVVTNPGVGLLPEKPDHAAVSAVMKQRSKVILQILERAVART